MPSSSQLKKSVRCLALVFAAAATPARAASFDASTAPEWRVAPTGSVDPAAEKRLYDYAFARTGTDLEKKGVRTDGLVVVKGGEIVMERYYEEGGYTTSTPHLSWSVAKSFINALFGIAELNGRLQMDDPVSKYLPGLAGAADASGHPLTLRHVMEMSSCLQWSETYEGSDFTASSVLAMLYGSERLDMSGFMTRKPLECAPGSKWEYSSGNTMLLSRVLKAVYGDEAYATLPWEALFEKIGIKGAVWERDAAGVFVGSSYLYATPRDYARFGYLFLKDGIWNGQRLLPAGWAAYSGRPAASLRAPGTAVNLADGIGGAHWWSNERIPEKNIPSYWASAPADTYSASGHWGQAIFVIPSLDVVIARVGDDRDGSYDENKLLSLVLAALKVPPPPGSESKTANLKPTADARHLKETALLGVPGLSSAFLAKELCSCLYVVHRNEADCASFATQSPALASYSIDAPAKAIHTALRFTTFAGDGLYARISRYHGEKFGCTLD